MASSEEKKYYELSGAAPKVQSSAQTANAAAALAQAERQAESASYGKTADARLDQAIADVLAQNGYRYDISKDQAYQDFAREYSQNALRGRELSRDTARTLANGYEPTYADAVGSEVYNDVASRAVNYAPSFKASANAEAAAASAQAMNAAQVYADIGNTEYSRQRDYQGDLKNYMSYLANRYSSERQADVQRGEFDNNVYTARLNAALNNLTDARKAENTKYIYNTQSAEGKAKLAADQKEFEQKLAYTAAKDAYDDRVAAEKAAAQAAKEQAAAEKTAKTEADKLESERAKHEKNAYLIQQYRVEKYKPSAEKQYELDYNKDGKIDKYDLALAQKAAQSDNSSGSTSNTGSSGEPYKMSAKTDRIIHFMDPLINSGGNQLNKQNFKNYLENFIEKTKLSDPEAAYIYAYYRNYLRS